MTNFLLKRFVKNYEQTGDKHVRSAVGRLAGIVGIVCNVLLFLGKLAVGILCGSMSITADAMNNLTDAASSIVTLVGFKLAEKPADSEHPYGHARFEYLSGLGVAALILVIGVELGKGSLDKILHPQAMEITIPALCVLVGSILAKLWLSRFNKKLGETINSTALITTAADSRNDVIATLAVLVASLVEWLTSWKIDGFMGLGVAIFIIYNGIMLGKETISPLLGEAASPELQQLIVRVVSAHPLVLGYHDLMVHDYGPGQRFASLHVEMDSREDPLLCHEVIDNLERACLQEHNVHLVIHYDPVAVGDERLDALKMVICQCLHTIDTRLTIHDFRMVSGKGHSNLIFDIVLPWDMEGRKQEIREKIQSALADYDQSTYHTVITFDPVCFLE